MRAAPAGAVVGARAHGKRPCESRSHARSARKRKRRPAQRGVARCGAAGSRHLMVAKSGASEPSARVLHKPLACGAPTSLQPKSLQVHSTHRLSAVRPPTAHGRGRRPQPFRSHGANSGGQHERQPRRQPTGSLGWAHAAPTPLTAAGRYRWSRRRRSRGRRAWRRPTPSRCCCPQRQPSW